MFETVPPSASLATLRSWLAQLAGPAGDMSDGELLDEIAVLEQLKGACAARQARLAVAFDESQRESQRAAGMPANQVGRGVPEQVALARRESPTQRSQHLGLAKALVHELPHTLDALSAGLVSEWTATVFARETACLAADDRRRVDAELADRLATLSTAQVRRESWAAACRLDPQAAVERGRRVVVDRQVSLRPAPDAMTYLTALLPVKDGVAAFAALDTAAGTARAAGDPRRRGQLMADTLVDRLTRGPAGEGDGDAVEVCLIMTDRTLLGGGDDPATVSTTGTGGSAAVAELLPAAAARDLVREAGRVFLRRLYADPVSGALVAMESTRRLFDGNLRRMLVLRDGTCRTPWCDAPIRHADHVVDHAVGGPTSLDNGQWLCERCNQTKNLPGWRAEVVGSGRDGPHVVRTTTPTGRTYDSTAPPLLRTG